MAALVVCLFLTGCSVTRYVPEGSYLLNRNVIVTDHSVPVGERVTAEEVDRFVRQTPARKLLRTNTLLAIWSMNDTTSNSLPNRIARGLGSAPTVLDSAMIYRSASNIESYLRSRGYYDSQLEWKVETRKRKAKVTYAITQGEPYRIGDVRYVFRDEHLRPVVLQDTTATLLHTGDVFDIGVLNAERSRISDDLRNRGYYNFSVNNINYLADTTRGNRTADLTLILRQYLSGYMADGQPEYENNTIYRLGPVYINPEYDPAAVIADPEYYNRLDTLEYMGLNILHSGKPRIRGKVLRRTVKLYQNNFYSARDVDEASADLMRLGYFRSAAIVFDDVTDSLQAGKTTYIGSDDQPTDQTTEGYLACRINCVPSMRQSYKVDFEGSMASNFFGIAATLGYQNRNLFRGAELLDISLTGRYEFSRQTKQTGSYEIGANVSLSFPHFLFPWNLNAKGRALVPRTRIEASLQYQHRQVYHRTLSGVRLAWSWNNRRNSSFILRPVDVNLIRVSFIDQDFLATLKNKYLRESYQSQLVPGLSGSYIYNTQLRNPGANANSMVFRFNFETVGNLFAGLSRAFSEPYFDEALDSKYYRFFGMRFTQYVRLEASLSNRIVTGRKSSFVWRVLAGGGASYGNATPIPIDRLFYSGGSNSMRGWLARRLGPGTIPAQTDSYPSQVGNLKLEANVEFRFPVWDFFHGALFVDTGNIWFAGRRNYEDPDMGDAAVFRFDTFAKQLGLNTGLGLRLDFSRFIFRVDWGIKLHDPGQPDHRRWIQNFRLRDTALNFGVGYPF